MAAVCSVEVELLLQVTLNKQSPTRKWMDSVFTAHLVTCAELLQPFCSSLAASFSSVDKATEAEGFPPSEPF